MKRHAPGGPSLPPRWLSGPSAFSPGAWYPWAFVRLDFQGPHVQLATEREPGSPRAPARRSEKAGAGRWLVGRLVAPLCGQSTRTSVCCLPQSYQETRGENRSARRQASRISAGLSVLQEAFLDRPCSQQASSVVV